MFSRCGRVFLRCSLRRMILKVWKGDFEGVEASSDVFEDVERCF